MMFIAFIIQLISHFAITFPSCLQNCPQLLYNKYQNQYKNNISIVTYQNTSNFKLIVLVHGRNSDSSYFLPFVDNLQKIQINASIVAVNLGSTGNTSVKDDATTLRHLLKIYSDKNIILVGFSKGGLTVSEYVATFGTDNISAVITISSPLGGTLIANYLLPTNHIASIELGYNSSFTQDLKSRLPKNIPFFHIVPTYDHLIIPIDSASIIGSNHKSQTFTGHNGHLDIIFDPIIAQYVANWIHI